MPATSGPESMTEIVRSSSSYNRKPPKCLRQGRFLKNHFDSYEKKRLEGTRAEWKYQYGS